jgi:SAM-dependent methyltransferase
VLKAFAMAGENAYWRLRLRLGLFESRLSTTNSDMTLDEEVEYVERTFREYKEYGGIRTWGRVAEVGPGRHAAVALLMRADGASGVDLIDRFYHPVGQQDESSLYECLSQAHTLSQFFADPNWDSHKLSGVTWLTGHSAEDYFARCADGTYDCIVSRATLEHLVDPLGALESMIRCTRSGGRLVHKVDLRDHGHFSQQGSHPLTWLTVPSWLWGFTTG